MYFSSSSKCNPDNSVFASRRAKQNETPHTIPSLHLPFNPCIPATKPQTSFKPPKNSHPLSTAINAVESSVSSQVHTSADPATASATGSGQASPTPPTARPVQAQTTTHQITTGAGAPTTVCLHILSLSLYLSPLGLGLRSLLVQRPLQLFRQR